MKNKKAFILSIVGVLTIIALIAGATFAYFSAQGGESKSANINVSTATTDVLTFTTGSAINIVADQTSFANGKDSLSGETFAKASLTANNSTNEATANYYVYLNIENNTFKYTLGESSPELLLTVTAPDGTEVTSINELEYKTATDNKGATISGFDVTKSSGVIALVNNDEITAGTSSSVGKASNEESWNIKLTFVNYGDDQTANAGAALSAKVMVQKIKYSTLANYIKNLYTGTQGENNLYYHDGTLTNGIDDNSYRYAGASSSVNNYVCFGSTDTTCPTDNLYRIIGVFGEQVKLIKLTSLGNEKAGEYGKSWSNSSLNTYLNDTYLTGLGGYTDKIVITSWKVGGNYRGITAETVPATTYQNEIVNQTSIFNAKIGLMYMSDYGFAASPEAWATTLNNYNGSVNGSTINSLNWMYLGFDEWTISLINNDFRDVLYTQFAFVRSIGSMSNDRGDNYYKAVRPTFYLNSYVTYASGTGSSSYPIRIN